MIAANELECEFDVENVFFLNLNPYQQIRTEGYCILKNWIISNRPKVYSSMEHVQLINMYFESLHQSELESHVSLFFLR